MSTEKKSVVTSEYLYVTTMILGMPGPKGTGNFPKKFLDHHRSMAELKEWVHARDLALGTPAMHSNAFAVEHVDGSPLSDEEMEKVLGFAGRAVPGIDDAAGFLTAATVLKKAFEE